MAQITIPNQAISVEYAVVVSSTGPFEVPFAFFQEEDIRCLVIDALLNEVTLLVTTDFTFTRKDVPVGQEGSGFTGGEITLVAPIGADGNTTIRIYRSTIIDRTNNYPNTGPFSVPLMNDELNKHIAIMQELAVNQAGGGAAGTDNLQDTTVAGKTTDQGIDIITGGVLRLFDPNDIQSLDIDMTINPARLTVTGGAGIQFLGALVEYFFDTDTRFAGDVTAQSNFGFFALNSLATASMHMRHDDIQGVLECIAVGPMDIRVDNGSATQVRRARFNDGNSGGSLYGGVGDNPVFRWNPQSGANISSAEVKDSSDTYRQIGLSTMLRINVTGVSTLGNNIWHKKIVSVGAATLTLDAGSLASIADDTVFWAIANVGAISIAGSGITVRKFLGGGAAVNGTVTIAEGGWATFTKHSATEVWVTGLDIS